MKELFAVNVPVVLRVVLFVLLALPPARSLAQEQADGGGKTLRLLAIGNSFSKNATTYLGAMADAAGHELVFGHAMINGASLERHVLAARKHEADPSDPAGAPYTVPAAAPGGGGGGAAPARVSLRQLLQSQRWDVVTIQQASRLSYRPESYRPFAAELAEYVRRHAPQARLVVHETWAYRPDHRAFLGGELTQPGMYEGLRAAYAAVAAEVGAAGIIPTGTAFQRALHDPRWGEEPAPPFDAAAYSRPPLLPPAVRSLWVTAYWDTTTKAAPRLVHDAAHAGPAGRFLGSAVWYAFFFGDVRTNPFVPPGLTPADAAALRAIAHETVTAAPPPPDTPTTRPAAATPGR